MNDYIDIVLTKSGVFCVAPAWNVIEGALVSLPNALTGAEEIQEVISVSTDKPNGEYITMIEKYIGYPLPRITAKYSKSEVKWDEPIQE